VKVKESAEFDRVTAVKPYRLFQEDLTAQPARFVAKFDASMAAALSKHGGPAGARVFWSMWPGYLEEPSGQRLRRTLQKLEIPIEIEHSSGQASITDLQRLAEALHPQRVVPIHFVRRTSL
jgi:ribonuclease J